VFSLVVVFGIGFYILDSGISLAGFFKDTAATISQAFKGVLGSGSEKGKTFEVDLNASSSNEFPLTSKQEFAPTEIKKTKKNAKPSVSSSVPFAVHLSSTQPSFRPSLESTT